MVKKIYVACDHAGFPLKSYLLDKLPDLPFEDLGTENEDRVDYPDFADKVAQKVNEDSVGLLICGSGQGMAMRANKYPHIRAALCWDEQTAQLAREHNDANVLCLGSRVLNHNLCEQILTTFLESKFEGGRHEARVDKIGMNI